MQKKTDLKRRGNNGRWKTQNFPPRFSATVIFSWKTEGCWRGKRPRYLYLAKKRGVAKKVATTRAARFPGKYGPTQQMGRKYSWHRFPVKTGKSNPTTFSPIYSIFQYPNPARICEFDRIPIFPPLPPPLYARGFPSPLIPDISIFGFCIAAEVEEAIEFLAAILYGKLDDRMNVFGQKQESTLFHVLYLPRA